ncbi:MAG: hypothetical protein ACP5QG_04465 [candidate division WOR-3 bacterium]
MALVFLVVFAVLHLTGDLVPIRTPLFGISESVWEYLKMGWWSFGITYGIFWAIRRKGSLFAIYTYKEPPLPLFQEPILQ